MYNTCLHYLTIENNNKTICLMVLTMGKFYILLKKSIKESFKLLMHEKGVDEI